MDDITQNEFQEICSNILSQVLNLAGKDLGKAGIKVDSEERKLYFGAYYLTIIEYVRSIKACIETNNLIAVTPVFRSCLEAFLDLVNLEKHEEYCTLLYASHIKEQISKLEALSADINNPYSQFISEIENVDKRLDDLRKEKRKALKITKQLRKDLGNPYSVSSKFKLAEAENEYGGIYGVISDECHNNLLSVERRHINSKSGIFNLEIFNPENFQKLIPQVHTIVGIVQTATKLRYEFLMGEIFKMNTNFESLKTELLIKLQVKESN